MALETATRLNQLVETNPANTDDIGQGPAHLRLIKAAVKGTFPNFTGTAQVSLTEAQINSLKTSVDALGTTYLARAGGSMSGALDMSGQRITGLPSPVGPTEPPRKQDLDALAATVSGLTTNILGRVFPVGALYFSTSVATNPSTLLGFGTWEPVAGRMILGAGAVDDGTDTQSFTAGDQGGSLNTRLTVDQLPEHSHKVSANDTSALDNDLTQDDQLASFGDEQGNNEQYRLQSSELPATLGNTSSVGTGAPIGNLPPYEVAHIWKRTA